LEQQSEDPPRGRQQRESAERAGRTYAAAADHYLAPSLSFWDRWGAATVARLPLGIGDLVLDLCCGAGASALPAARAVGPEGRVIGIDLAEPLLSLAVQRAEAFDLTNVEFRAGDATTTGFADESFDTVVCVFGVFFAADMPAFVAEMWRLVRPGGTLAITTWGPDWCEPASSIFWESVRTLEPGLCRQFNPWDKITTEAGLWEVLARGGVNGATVNATTGELHALRRPEDFWDIVLGSGYRATVIDIGKAKAELLREHVIGELRTRGVTNLCNDVVFADAVKIGDTSNSRGR
jgi:ubiquinone/menaquinone biosynthesis C-methylase UbiE